MSNLFLYLLFSTVAASLQLNLLTATVEELSFHLASNHITSVQLVEKYLAQISAHNEHGLGLHAVIDVAPTRQVLSIAAQLDYERRTGKSRGALHGIPVLVKDNIATHPELGMRTTAGSLALAGSIVPGDAVVIAKLRRAGAIILGKTNMSEWANMRGAFGHIPNGWSARGGQTISAYVSSAFNRSERDPSGSSSGSAVGVSAGFAPLSFGTETDGSIVLPANRAALYAIKPTVGSVSAGGVIPVAPWSMDSVGVMAKSVWDLAVGLGAIVDDDGAGERYLDAWEKGRSLGWEGIKVGIVGRDVFWDPEITGEQIISESLSAITNLQSLNATITTITIPSLHEALSTPTQLLITLSEFNFSLNRYLSTLRNTSMHNLSSLITFNNAHSTLEMPHGHCCQELFLAALTAPNTTSALYRSALHQLHLLARQRGIDYAFRMYDVDVLVVPTEAPRAAALAAMAGYPIATVPLGYARGSGRPFGVSFFTRGGEEEVLVRVLAAWEVVVGRRRVPGELVGRGGVAKERGCRLERG